MNLKQYVLVGHEPVVEEDIMKAAAFLNDPEKRRVARDQIGDALVSTVFLSIDHAFGGGPPVLFETIIFGGEHDQYQDRYHTWDEAVAGHERAIEMILEA